jgi:hypothetical protein
VSIALMMFSCCALFTCIDSCAALCYAMLCYAMLCYAMLCYAMLCYAMPCHANFRRIDMQIHRLSCVYTAVPMPQTTSNRIYVLFFYSYNTRVISQLYYWHRMRDQMTMMRGRRPSALVAAAKMHAERLIRLTHLLIRHGTFCAFAIPITLLKRLMQPWQRSELACEILISLTCGPE